LLPVNLFTSEVSHF